MANGLENNTSPLGLVTPAALTDTTGVFSSKNFFDGTKTWTSMSISTDISYAIIRAYQRAMGGQDSFFWDVYSLRHTTNASNRGYSNIADYNVNRIYTQAQFLSEITNGTFWIFPAPIQIISALNTVFTGLGTAPSNYLKGALKGGSSRVTTANNRVNIVTEYKLLNWSTDDYDLAT